MLARLSYTVKLNTGVLRQIQTDMRYDLCEQTLLLSGRHVVHKY